MIGHRSTRIKSKIVQLYEKDPQKPTGTKGVQ